MTTTEPAATKHWHAQPAEQVCADLETDPTRGLTPDEATQRLTRHGPNRLASIPLRAGEVVCWKLMAAAA